MGRPLESAGTLAEQEKIRRELLNRLGLSGRASDEEIEAAHNNLVEFLESAPEKLRSWATARVAVADEALALLLDPAQVLTTVAVSESQELTTVAAEENPVEATPTALSTPIAFSTLTALSILKRWWQKKILRTSLLLALVVAVILGVYSLGESSKIPGILDAPTSQASAAPSPAAVDQANVTALMEKVSANPADISSLQGLGDIYFDAADYPTAAVWVQKILAIDPKNQVALLALGAAQFNLGNNAEAEKQWLVAAALYPNSVEVNYNLGFLYLSQSPPDMAKVIAAWNKVIAIDPNSSVAKSVATHLKGLQTPSPSASVTPSRK